MVHIIHSHSLTVLSKNSFPIRYEHGSDYINLFLNLSDKGY